jgi:hypothetical protein
MKVPITLSIEHEKKILFESTKDIHGKTFSNILDDGLTACLSEIVPSQLLEEEISLRRIQLAELEQNLVKVKMIEEQMKLQQKATEQEDNVTGKFLEDMRTQKFEEFKDSTIKLWKKGGMNWPRIVDLYQFKSTSEAKEWFAKKMAEVIA